MKGLIPALALCTALPVAVVSANPDQPAGPAAPPVSGFAAHRPSSPPIAVAPGSEPGVQLVAQRLAALEIEIGIRQEQLEAWRNFTDALLAVTQPPRPPVAPGAAEAFAITAAFGTDLAERGKRAEALIAAVGKLRSMLTPDQLERAKRAEAAAAPMMPPGVPGWPGGAVGISESQPTPLSPRGSLPGPR